MNRLIAIVLAGLALGCVPRAHADPCYLVSWNEATAKADVAKACEAPREAIIRSSRGTLPLWQDSLTAKNDVLEPDIDFTPVINGFDVDYNYDNQTGQVRSLGEFVIDGIRFGEDVTFEDLRITDLDDPPLAVGPGFGPQDDFSFGEAIAGSEFKTGYPVNWFVPCFVIHDSNYTIGISLLYPVLDYQHRVRFSVVSDHDRDAFGRSWTVRIRLNPSNGTNNGGAQYTPQGELDPGEQATYRVCVRILRNDPAWTSALMPYREWFQANYGTVDYWHARDPRPVRGEFITRKYAIDTCSGDLGYWDDPEDTSPYYATVMNPRTPGNGWRAWTDNFKDVTSALGYERIMVWRMCGEFTKYFPCPDHQIYNIPFIFASNMPLIGVDQPMPGDSYLMMNEVAAAGVEFGMYWGRAGQPMAPLATLDDWNLEYTMGPPASGMVFTNDPIDITDPGDQALALNEFHTALEAGAQWIGLDATSQFAPWDLCTWMNTLASDAVTEGYGQVRLTHEPFRNDFLITSFPAMQVGDRLSEIPGGPRPSFITMCDFIAPGHEVYSIINGSPNQDEVKPEWVNGTPAFRIARAHEHASWGMIPVMSPANAVEDATPTNNFQITPKPPIYAKIPNPKGGGDIFDTRFLAHRSWQDNPFLPDDPAIRRLGDVNLDGHCDQTDLDLVMNNMGWNPQYDLDADGHVSMTEVTIVTTWLNSY
ncbi:MAG: hypothetical protein KDA21_03835 [Phycisphaerales bacterium]|nr:hypothetical protein [Phycisphaerales bacterium]